MNKRAAQRVAYVAGALAFACQVYDSSLLEPGEQKSAVPEELWGSGIGWWSSINERGCVNAGVPKVEDRPSDTASGTIDPVYFAVRDMALGSLGRDQLPGQDAWKTLGFDLDGVCTLSTTSFDQSCEDVEQQSCTPTSTAIPIDGHDCRDNTFGRLEATAVSLPEVGKDLGLSNDGFNCSLCSGVYNFVIKLSEWNGQPDDSNVRVDFYPSPGLETPFGWQCDINAPTGDWKKHGECWTKDDAWTIAEGSYTGELSPGKDLPPALLYDAAAYVRQGYVVGQLPANTLLWFPGDQTQVRAYPLKLQHGIFAGKLEQKPDGSWQIADGTIAGRSKALDLIEGFEQLGFCSQHPNYGLMKFEVNNRLDILSTGSVSPDATCDAMSVGIGFTADEASYSSTPRTVTPLPGCPQQTDGGTDAGQDATPDTGPDTGPDAEPDAGSDASVDASADGD